MDRYAMGRYAIEISNLNVYYGKVCALSDINMKVREGDFVGIIGPNGGGKSTLLKAILGLVPAASGSIKVFGKDIRHSDTVLGYVPQFTTFDRRFPINVEEVVLTGCLPRSGMFFHRYSPDDRKKALDIMKRLDVYNLRKKHIGSLSGGQLQRVMIARALAEDPLVLLLDEPTASIDTSSRLTIFDILRELNEKITILLVTHDVGAVSSYVKTIACLNTTLYHHGGPALDKEVVEKAYGSPVDFISHGISYRVLDEHDCGHGGRHEDRHGDGR
jgi:zinc transport system ATP-binding protein